MLQVPFSCKLCLLTFTFFVLYSVAYLLKLLNQNTGRLKRYWSLLCVSVLVSTLDVRGLRRLRQCWPMKGLGNGLTLKRGPVKYCNSRKFSFIEKNFVISSLDHFERNKIRFHTCWGHQFGFMKSVRKIHGFGVGNILLTLTMLPWWTSTVVRHRSHVSPNI